jgi:hypothetical protein
LLSVLIAAAGTITAIVGMAIVGLGLRVKVRVAASRTRDASFDV